MPGAYPARNAGTRVLVDPEIARDGELVEGREDDHPQRDDHHDGGDEDVRLESIQDPSALQRPTRDEDNGDREDEQDPGDQARRHDRQSRRRPEPEPRFAPGDDAQRRHGLWSNQPT